MSATSDPDRRRLTSYSHQAPPPTASMVLPCDLKPLPEHSDRGFTTPPDAITDERGVARMSGADLAVRVNFITFIRGGSTLKEAAAIAGCTVRTIHGWLSDDANFRQQFHHARWEAESEALEPVRQLAPESVQAAIYLAERRRKKSLRRTNSHADQSLEDFLTRIESSLRAMLGGFASAVHSIEDEQLRKRLGSELQCQVEPVSALFNELWQGFEAGTT